MGVIGATPMSYFITHRYGSMDREPSLAALPELLAELEERPEETEHGSVALTHESEWCISVSRGGYVIFENLENGGERHMNEVPVAKILRMWEQLAAGEISALEALPWLPGYE